MPCKHDHRAAVSDTLHARKSAQEIIQSFSYPKTLVCDLRKEDLADDNPDEVWPDQKQHKHWSDAKWTEEFIENLHEKIVKDPSQLMVNLAVEMKCSKSTICLNVHKVFCFEKTPVSHWQNKGQQKSKLQYLPTSWSMHASWGQSGCPLVFLKSSSSFGCSQLSGVATADVF